MWIKEADREAVPPSLDVEKVDRSSKSLNSSAPEWIRDVTSHSNEDARRFIA